MQRNIDADAVDELDWTHWHTESLGCPVDDVQGDASFRQRHRFRHVRRQDTVNDETG